jgi:hypothetical protein
MPFSHVAPAFQPEQLAKLTEAFDRAWPAVYLADSNDNSISLAWQRERLANYILACASQGEFDPNKLAGHALRALIKRDRTAAPTEANSSQLSQASPGDSKEARLWVRASSR